ncbi:MAG: DUF3179 domain-containing protein [Deinococcota bacterium]|nr:DUF3179 domain-containing protein [Deinococcota bacterium]
MMRQSYLLTTLGLLALASLAAAQLGLSALGTIGVDAEQATIPVEEILSGGPPPQGIPALGFTGDHAGAATANRPPSFVTQEEAAGWLADEEPVIAMTVNGESRAYPLQILTWHEIANDTLGGVPVAVTFCPLCNSALAFDRRIPLGEEEQRRLLERNPQATFSDLDEAFLAAYRRQGEEAQPVAGLEVSFGVSGMLYLSNLLMFDTESSTLWSQLIGEGVVGTLAGTDLLRYPAQIVSFEEFREAFPDALVLSQDTGYSRAYGTNPYVGYDRADSPAFLFSGPTDGRLPPKERVITFELGGESVAYPFSELSEARVVEDMVGGEPVVLFWQPGTRSALDASAIARGEDVGAVGAFSRRLNDRELSFRWDGEGFVDSETGSSWNLLGQAAAGELEGEALTPIVHDNTLWFAWAAFKPETRIYLGSAE